MNSMKNFLFVVVAFAYTLVGCSSKQQVSCENISANDWKLTEYVDGNGFSIDMNENIILSFRDSVMVAGNTGCNLFMGKYSITESKVKIENIGSTKVFCGDDKAQIEQNYLNALSLELDAEISSDGGELILTNAENGITIKYAKSEEIDIPKIQ